MESKIQGSEGMIILIYEKVFSLRELKRKNNSRKSEEAEGTLGMV